MNILVAVASRHGATHEIADAIAEELRAAGHTVDVQDAAEVGAVEKYGAVIVGSAVYVGSWRPEATRFIEGNQEKLTTTPVWLFSSGPIGHENPQPKGDPLRIDKLMQVTRARGHRNFAGKLDHSTLNFGERITVKMVRAPAGDYRDWEAIRSWAREISAALPVPATANL